MLRSLVEGKSVGWGGLGLVIEVTVSLESLEKKCLKKVDKVRQPVSKRNGFVFGCEDVFVFIGEVNKVGLWKVTVLGEGPCQKRKLSPGRSSLQPPALSRIDFKQYLRKSAVRIS